MRKKVLLCTRKTCYVQMFSLTFITIPFFLDSETTTLKTCILAQTNVNYCELISERMTVLKCAVTEYLVPLVGRRHHHHHHKKKTTTTFSTTKAMSSSTTTKYSSSMNPATQSSSSTSPSPMSSQSTAKPVIITSSTPTNSHETTPGHSRGSNTRPSLIMSISLAIALLPQKWWNFEKILITSLVSIISIVFLLLSIIYYILVVQK